MFGKKSDKGYKQVLDGIQIKTIVYGQDTLMTEFLLEKNSVLPAHSHEHEQTGYLVKGKIKLFVGEASAVINPGDSWNIPSNVTHRAEILADSVALEIFSPCRVDYLEYIHSEDIIG